MRASDSAARLLMREKIVDYFLNQYKLNKQKRRNPREVQLSLVYRALHVNVQSKPHLHKFENC